MNGRQDGARSNLAGRRPPLGKPERLLLWFALSTLIAACGGDEPVGPELVDEYIHPCAAAPLQLAVGELSVLPMADSTCVRLASTPGRYSLVFLDVRPQRQARAEAEAAGLRREPAGSFRLRVGGSVTVDGIKGLATSSSLRISALPEASVKPVHQVISAKIDCRVSGGLFCLDGPWVEGDTVDITTLHDDNTRFVVWLTEGPFAFVSAIGVADTYVSQWQAEIREIVRQAREPMLDLLDGSFAGPRPVTLNNGQIVYFVRPPVPGNGSTVAVHAPYDSPVRFYVILDLPLVANGRPSSNALHRALEVFVHEAVHGWQWAHLRHHRPSDGIYKVAWSNEGGAQFLTEEIMRQVLGLPLDAQLDLDLAEESDLQGYMLRRILSGAGTLLDGYDEITPFLRHLLHKGLRAGGDYEIAMAAVLSGSLEGWYGTVSEVGAFAGLEERMSQLLGYAWNPESGLLEWIAAHAADDRTEVEGLQVPFLHQAWRRTPRNAWPALRTLSLRPGDLSTFELAVGAAGYVNLLSQGDESLHLWSGAPGVHRWALVRWD